MYAVTSNYLELAELGLSSHHLSNYFVKLFSSLDLFGSGKIGILPIHPTSGTDRSSQYRDGRG